MVEDKGDGRGVEANIERVQHGAGHRHAVMRLEHRRNVGRHEADGVAEADAARRQRRSQAARTIVEFPVSRLALTGGGVVPPGDAFRVDMGGAREKAERRQRHMVGGVLRQAHFIRVSRGGIIGHSLVLQL